MPVNELFALESDCGGGADAYTIGEGVESGREGFESCCCCDGGGCALVATVGTPASMRKLLIFRSAASLFASVSNSLGEGIRKGIAEVGMGGGGVFTGGIGCEGGECGLYDCSVAICFGSGAGCCSDLDLLIDYEPRANKNNKIIIKYPIKFFKFLKLPCW